MRGVSGRDELDYALGRIAPVRALENVDNAAQLVLEKRDERIGSTQVVLIDEEGQARSTAEAPEIDGIIRFDPEINPGAVPGRFARAEIVARDESSR